jgi:hypothetical protein
MFQAIKGDYRAEIWPNVGIRTWRANLYLKDKLLEDFMATSAEKGKKLLHEKLKQIKLWDEK